MLVSGMASRRISESIFRAYDIRGIYGLDIDEDVARIIGRALADYAGRGKTFIVGRDVRLSSKPLSEALIDGMVSGGLNVEDIGVVTTPLLYFATRHYNADGGVMVSASHNPPEWNGFKILFGRGFICMGSGMEEFKRIALKVSFEESRIGSVKANPNAVKDYEEYVLSRVNIGRGIKVAADPGGGSCTVLVPEIFRRAGLEAYAIYDKPDGSFSKHPPEPDERTLGELRGLVREYGADFGVCFDGDGDRALFIDDKGRLASSSIILSLLARHYLSEHRGAAVVYEVSCSMVVEEVIRALGGRPILSRVGHTYIYDKMISEDAVLGGETSGHFYFRDVYGFDDAVYASLKVAEVISKDGRKLSEIIDSMPRYPQTPVKNYSCPDEEKFRVVEELASEFISLGYKTITIDGVKVMTEDGWFLIRPSNTQPLIRMIAEAKDETKLMELASLAEREILKKIKACK
ncbi:phosphomannomutase/phosphoglucomutase [Candidatus Bathyarchaeota archaeon]|nr:phosphomannomutase/phosphoglucomutase [Candidatus Bathyarchaeota archaeon]